MTRSSSALRVREPSVPTRDSPALTLGVSVGAGSTLLHNNLGGQGDDEDDAESPSQVPGCEGLTKTDDCSQAMGALALSTQSPEGLGPA